MKEWLRNLWFALGLVSSVNMVSSQALASRDRTSHDLGETLWYEYNSVDHYRQSLLNTDRIYSSERYQIFESQFYKSIFSNPRSFALIERWLEDPEWANEQLKIDEFMDDYKFFSDSFMKRISIKWINIWELMIDIRDRQLEDHYNEIDRYILQYLRENPQEIDRVVRESFTNLSIREMWVKDFESEDFREFYWEFRWKYWDCPELWSIREMRARYWWVALSVLVDKLWVDEDKLRDMIEEGGIDSDEFSEEQKNFIREQLEASRKAMLQDFERFKQEMIEWVEKEISLSDYQKAMLNAHNLYQDAGSIVNILWLINPVEANQARQFIKWASMIHKWILALTQNWSNVASLVALWSISWWLWILMAMSASQWPSETEIILDAIWAVLENQKIMIEKLNEISMWVENIKIKLWEIENKLILFQIDNWI